MITLLFLTFHLSMLYHQEGSNSQCESSDVNDMYLRVNCNYFNFPALGYQTSFQRMLDQPDQQMVLKKHGYHLLGRLAVINPDSVKQRFQYYKLSEYKLNIVKATATVTSHVIPERGFMRDFIQFHSILSYSILFNTAQTVINQRTV